MSSPKYRDIYIDRGADFFQIIDLSVNFADYDFSGAIRKSVTATYAVPFEFSAVENFPKKCKISISDDNTSIIESNRGNRALYDIFATHKETGDVHKEREGQVFLSNSITDGEVHLPPQDYVVNIDNVSGAGTAAKSDIEDFATAAQGILADSALQIADVIDNLTSVDTDKALSANQGKILKDLVDSINTLLASDDISLDDTESVLNALAGDPAVAGKIGADFLPQSLELDYITLGETGEAALPQGTLTRVGNELRMFNEHGVAEPVVQESAGQENLVPYHRVSGRALLIPYGQPGWVGRDSPNGLQHYVEFARVKIPGADFYGGNELTIKMKLRSFCPANLPSNYKFALMPLEKWDVCSIDPNFNTLTTPVWLGHLFNPIGSTTTDCVATVHKVHPITWNPATGLMTFETATIVNAMGYRLAPTPSTWGQSVTTGLIVAARPYEDVEFVAVAWSQTDPTKYVDVAFDISVDAAPPAPAAPSGLIGSIASPTSAQLDWTDNSSNATGFEIWRSSSGYFYQKIATVAAGVTTYVDADYPIVFGTNEYGTGYYKVRAMNGRTPSDFSSTVNVTPA